MKILVVNRNLIVSIFTVILLVYGLQGISYGQRVAPTVTPGENNTSLVVKFQITLDEGVDENAYQVQLRRKTPPGEWISKCVVIEYGKGKIAGDPDVSASPKQLSGGLFASGGGDSYTTFHIRAPFTNLDPATTYEVRYRDTNLPECVQNPPAPDPWSKIGEGRTYGVITEPGGRTILYFVHHGSIHRVSNDGTHRTNIVIGLSEPRGVALDAARGKIYWTDYGTDKIQRANLDGSNVETVVESGLSSPVDIAVDTAGGKIYWADTETQKIQRANLDGTDIQDIVTGLGYPEGIALDVAEGKIYWVDSWTDKIQRANLDGTNIQDIIVTGLRYPGGVALDVAEGKIYWTDDGTDKIQRANLDGTDIQSIVTGLSSPRHIALDIAEGKIYWTDDRTDKIQRANLDGTNIQDVAIGMRYIRGIALTTSTVSYGQRQAPTVTPGENNTSLIVRFSDFFSIREEEAYQVQLRQKSPQGEWITICRSRLNTSLIRSYTAVTLIIKAIFIDLEPGTTYEVRYRDTNVSECTENPPNPDPWSHVAEGTTHLVAPPRATFVDAKLAKAVRSALNLDSKGAHIDFLKIPEAALAKLTELSSSSHDLPVKITNLTGLEHATQLTNLNLSYNDISDVTPLTQLSQLVELNLSHNNISDVTPLFGLKSLKKLYLEGNPIWDQDTNPLIAYLDANPDVDLDIAKFLIRIREKEGPTVYWAERIDNTSYIIRRMDLANGQLQDVVTLSEYPRDIAIDTSGGKIYWCSESTIKSANLDGTDIQLVTGGLDSVTGIYLDVSGGKIYWMNHGQRKIQRADLDGANVEDLITGLSNNPIDLAVDVSGGKIYWTNNYGQVKIQRADLDGANVKDLITRTESANTTAIDLDVSGGKIYWLYAREKIQRANLDGTDIKDIVSRVGYGDLAVDISAGKIYWLDRERGTIKRADLDGANVEVLIETEGYLMTAFSLATRLQDKSAPIISDSTIVQIHSASVASPAVGEQLELSLNITGGEAVAGYQATMQFDDTALRYVSAANGDYLPAGAFFVEPKVEGNLIKLNAASLAGESNGNGTLATLTFEVIAAKASTLTLSDVLLSSKAGETFVPKIENAEITEPTGLKEDVNGDGTINIADLVLVAGALSETGQNIADVNGDGQVNIADLVLVAGALGTSAAAPSLHRQSLDMLTAADVKQWLSQAQQLGITDTTSQRGILFLQQLLAALTPKETALLANYPNPFNPETWLPYHLAKPADVTLYIYTVNGTLVRTLRLGHQPAGMYQNRSRAAYWDGKNAFGESVASGVYFYALTAGDFTATRKMLIRK